MTTEEVFDYWTKPERWAVTKALAKEVPIILPEVRKTFFRAVRENLPQTSISNNDYWVEKSGAEKGEIKQVSMTVDGWGESVRLCLGKYPRWYYGIEGERSNSYADRVKSMLDGTGLEHYDGDSEYNWWQRYHWLDNQFDPFDWPQHGKKEMEKLASKIADLIQENLLKPYGDKILRIVQE